VGLVSAASPPADVGLTWRPIGEPDLPAWHELVRAVEDADAAAERHTVEELRDELVGASWKDPASDSLLGVDSGGVPRAFGHVEVRPGDERTVRAFCWGGVHPQWRGRGIGRRVLDWQEARGRQKLAAAARGVPGRLLVHAEEGREDVRRLVETAGFAAVRWYVDMSRPLPGPPIPEATLDAGLRIAPFDSGLSEAVRSAHNESFAEHWGSEPRSPEDWQRLTVGHRSFRPDWTFVVLAGDEVAGYTLASAYEQDWPAQGYTSGWTDLLGVRPAWRRRGLAPALLAASMRAFADAGMERADIGVDSENASGAMGLYTRLGYVPVRRTVAYAKDVA
jgi:mycothiol synthase